MPVERDIGLAYSNYYTHSADSEKNETGIVMNKPGLLSWLSRVTGLQARKRRSFLLYIDNKEPGRLLELGCGDGKRLAEFQSLGWDVVGQETDRCAASRVQDLHGIDVLVGS
ncbi:MAG TPA: class I SAM-dependent methyltransferase, partial [Ghiorsea sp.]|nr:class I SAM-dependent methyltransferase [Ghiorsea sp.]